MECFKLSEVSALDLGDVPALTLEGIFRGGQYEDIRFSINPDRELTCLWWQAEEKLRSMMVACVAGKRGAE